MTRNFRTLIDWLPAERQAAIKAHADELMQRMLPDGVHYLSDESCVIMHRIAERSAELEARFVKRVS